MAARQTTAGLRLHRARSPSSLGKVNSLSQLQTDVRSANSVPSDASDKELAFGNRPTTVSFSMVSTVGEAFFHTWQLCWLRRLKQGEREDILWVAKVNLGVKPIT
jgi:hypothetical protein